MGGSNPTPFNFGMLLYFNLDIIHQYMSIYFLFLAMCWRASLLLVNVVWHTGIPVWWRSIKIQGNRTGSTWPGQCAETLCTSNSDDGFSSPWGRSWSCCTVWLRAAPQEWVVPLLGVTKWLYSMTTLQNELPLGVQNDFSSWKRYKMGCLICQSIPPNSLQHMARNKKYIDIYWWIISKLN